MWLPLKDALMTTVLLLFLSAASHVTEKSTDAGSLESPLESASSEFWSSEFSLPFRHLFFSFNFKILVFNIFT